MGLRWLKVLPYCCVFWCSSVWTSRCLDVVGTPLLQMQERKRKSHYSANRYTSTSSFSIFTESTCANSSRLRRTIYDSSRRRKNVENDGFVHFPASPVAFSCLLLSRGHALRCNIVESCLHPCRTVALNSRSEKGLYLLADRDLLQQKLGSCYNNSLLHPSTSKSG